MKHDPKFIGSCCCYCKTCKEFINAGGYQKLMRAAEKWKHCYGPLP